MASTASAPQASPFESLIALVASAAAAVAATLALFHSFLEGLVPPIADAQQTIGMVSFGTMVVLLALSLLIRKRLSSARQQALAVLALLMLAVAFWAFFTYRDVVRTYVFAYPAELPPSQQTRYIRGDLHAKGEERRQGHSIAETVARFGGPQLVIGHEVLWTEASQQVATGRLERWYAGLSMLLTCALYVVAVALWRALPARARPPKASPPRLLPEEES